MTWLTRSLAIVGIAASAALALGAVAQPASAYWDDDRWHHGWTGGYWEPPPPAYGYYGYYAPPVVYGPSVGVNLPGVTVNIPIR